MRVNEENKNVKKMKNQKMLDFGENCFFQKKFDPLISNKNGPRATYPQKLRKRKKKYPKAY